tara:strand:- start:1489 stop:1791 length:303 start_codon:yes stop_codon:yes gene_type:complete
MIKLLKGFAYLCIWSTPFQIAFIIWGLWIVSTSNYTVISLTNFEFFKNYLTFILAIFNWLYGWFWNPLLDFVLSLPMVIHQSIKAIFSTWLGLWILKKLN